MTEQEILKTAAEMCQAGSIERHYFMKGVEIGRKLIEANIDFEIKDNVLKITHNGFDIAEHQKTEANYQC